MSKQSVRPWKTAFGSRGRVDTLTLGLLATLAACSVDDANLRAPSATGRDASSVQPAMPDGAGAGDDGPASWTDAGDETGTTGGKDIDVGADVSGSGEVLSAGDLTGGPEGGLDEANRDSGGSMGGVDGGGTGGTGGSADASAAGGAGGMAGNGNDTGGKGGMAGDANGAGGMGGMAGGGAGGAGGMANDANDTSDGGEGGTDGGTGGVVGDSDGAIDDGKEAPDEDTGGDEDMGRGGDDTGGVVTDDAGGLDADAEATDASGLDDVAADMSDEEVGGPDVDPDLVLWYRFDESSGTIAYDSAKFGGVARDATLATVGMGASATFSTTRQVGTHALALSPTAYSTGGGYLVVPTLHSLAPEAVTIAVWVKLAAATANQNWERIFDYANSSTSLSWFNLTARRDTSPYGPMFAISNTGHATSDQQRLLSSIALPANAWRHIAVVLPAGTTYTGVMYIDGVVVASNSAMTVHLSDIGATANNWIGRSEFSADPYFYGSMDDFRVYKRALSQQEIVTLMAVR
jgi:hypothetical protein